MQCRRTLRGRKLVYVCIVVTVIFAAPRRILEWGIQYRKRFAAIGLMLSKRVFNKKLTMN